MNCEYNNKIQLQKNNLQCLQAVFSLFFAVSHRLFKPIPRKVMIILWDG